MRKLVVLFGLLFGLAVAAYAQDTPKAEVFGGYSYFHTSVAGTGFNYNGGSGSVAVNLNDWFGIEGDIGVYHHGGSGIPCTECSPDSTVVSYLFGPKLAYRRNSTVTPFFHALFGGAHVSNSFGGASSSDSAFAMAIGGGLDFNVTPHVAIRAPLVDYALTKFSDGVNDRQNSVRVSAGIVFRWK